MPFVSDKKKRYRKKDPKKGLKKMITSVIRSTAETKKLELSYSGTSISTTITDSSFMDSISQGTAITERIGNDVYVTGLHGRYFFVTGDTTQIIRMILYIPKRADVTLSTQTQDTVTSIIDPTNFTVLLDRLLVLSTYQPIKRGTIGYKFKGRGLKVRYDPDTGSVQGSRIRLAIVSDSGAVPHPNLHMNFMAYYKDY